MSGATLSPTFYTATTTYSATVANAVTQVTITATTSETTATIEYLDNSDATLTDADTMTAGLQVNLSVGSNIVKVKVTAPDTTTTETYTVNVFRVAVPVACSPASMTNRIWTATLTVAEVEVGGTVYNLGFNGFPGSPGFGSISDNNFDLQAGPPTPSVISPVHRRRSQQRTAAGQDPPIAADLPLLTLHLGSDSFLLADATASSGTAMRTLDWSSHGLSWADGDAVLPGADGRRPGRLVGRPDLRPRIRQHLRDRRRGRGDGDLRRGGRHHRHPAAGAGL